MLAMQTTPAPTIPTGTEVEVLDRFTGAWRSGFTVTEVLDEEYVVRRQSDGWVLPVSFGAASVWPRRKA
ncbi:MAG: hypothetical protein ACYDAD_11815 [Acidimicrobiales bacterium]